MDNQEAKFILKAYRSNGADAGDPAFREALEQAQRDPALREWLSEQQALDQAIAGKLKSIPAPASLRESILAGARAGSVRRSWWRSQAWLAIAAGLMVAIGLSFAWRQVKAGRALDRLAEFAAYDLLHGQHGGRGEEVHRLVSVLEDRSTHLAASLNIDPQKLGATGCRSLSFAGHEIVEVCFARNGAEFHLYIARRGDLVPAGKGPRFAQAGKAATMAWSDANFVYVVAGDSGTDRLRALL